MEGNGKFWPITPAPAPRQSRRDKFDPKPRVQRYRAFCEEVLLRRVWAPEPGDLVVFVLGIPRTRRGEGLEGQPHRQIPDVDNLLKALLDAIYGNDSHVWAIQAVKVWGTQPGIYIERGLPPVEVPFEVPAAAAT